MKKILLTFAMATLSVSLYAQASATPTVRFIPFLSGYNALAVTNIPIAPGVQDILYTDVRGAANFSYYTNLLNTNLITADATKYGMVGPDANGDYNAVAAFWIEVGNTNWIPLITTNANGQYYIPPPGFTNNSPFSPTAPYGGWVLGAAGYSFWQYPATTNVYQYAAIATGDGGTFVTAATNWVTTTIYGAPALTASGGGADSIGVTNTALWYPIFTNQLTVITGVKPTIASVPLPAGTLQGVKYVYATILCSTNGMNTWNTALIVNQAGISIPLP